MVLSTIIYCPDCRGQFSVANTDVSEEEILECSLCAAEIQIMQINPLRVRLFSEEYDF